MLANLQMKLREARALSFAILYFCVKVVRRNQQIKSKKYPDFRPMSEPFFWAMTKGHPEVFFFEGYPFFGRPQNIIFDMRQEEKAEISLETECRKNERIIYKDYCT